MAKKIHIPRREPEVGTKTIGICGKIFKVKALWDDIPQDKTICRKCVDVAVQAMVEADDLITRTRFQAYTLLRRATTLSEVLTPDTLLFDQLDEIHQEFEDEQAEKRALKEVKEKAKSTCTCTWETPELFKEDENCPIHGHSSGGTGYDDAGLGESEVGNDGRPPVAPQEDK